MVYKSLLYINLPLGIYLSFSFLVFLSFSNVTFFSIKLLLGIFGCILFHFQIYQFVFPFFSIFIAYILWYPMIQLINNKFGCIYFNKNPSFSYDEIIYNKHSLKSLFGYPTNISGITK